MGVIKMNKNIKLATVIMGLGLVLFSYQNCSQIKPGLVVTDNKVSGLGVDGDTQAIILDQDDNIVDVIPDQQQDAEPVVQEEAPIKEEEAPVVEQQQPEAPVEVVNQDQPAESKGPDREDKEPKQEIVKEETVKEEVAQMEEAEQEDTAEEIQAGSCVDLAKKYKNAIDVSQLEAGAKIALLKGKTFIYSSTGVKTISSLSIGKACGRTILCDVTIEKIGEVNGRLDLYKDSSVLEYGSQPKNIKRRQ